MFGEPIQSLNNALRGMINNLRYDAQAVDSVHVSIISFDREAREILPLTDLPSLQLPEIQCPQSGPTFTGKALELLASKVETEVRKGTPTQKGDWRPLLFIFTDGKPSDIQLYNEMIPKVRALNFAAIIGCAAGNKSDTASLMPLCSETVSLETTDAATLMKFFQWVTDIIEQGSKSAGLTNSIPLPPKPTEENNVT
jgi:uncharacterized protein YegL